MIIPIIYPSAAEFWLDGSRRKHLDRFALNSRTPSNIAEGFDFYAGQDMCRKLASRMYLNEPLYVGAPTAGDRRAGPSFICKCLPKLPEYSFVKVGSLPLKDMLGPYRRDLENMQIEIYVASPEMCFLMAARYLKLEELIELGFKLCARYVLDDSSKYGQRNREILTTKKTIGNFLAGIESYPGLDKARRAHRYILNNSNSPMETIIAIFAILPPHLGGYGLGMPELNASIYLNPQATELMGREILLGDMVWEIWKVVVEYDSNICHLDPEQHSYDKNRMRAMNLSGYKVFSITSNDISCLEELDKTFAGLRAMLGLKSNAKKLNDYYDVRKNLFNSLLGN